MEKVNCWEFKKCGREPGGEHEHDLGICPAAVDDRLSGIHGGENAGRACWLLAGTFCGGKVQGSFAQKFSSCEECEFYRKVRDEEGINFELSLNLLNRLKEKK